VRVNPAYTSQTCSGCGHRQEMPLSVRVYECPVCGLVIDRDHNGSKNILDEALEAVGRHGRVIPEALGAGAVGSRHHLKNSLKPISAARPSATNASIWS
jgi:transposase